MIDEKHIDKADGILTKLKTLLKKHWGLLILLLICYFIYWALTAPVSVEGQDYLYYPEETYQEEVVPQDSVYYDSTEYYQQSEEQ